MNLEKPSQQEPKEQVHILILLRSSAGDDPSQEEMNDSVQEFTFAICGNQEKFLQYANHHEQEGIEGGTTVVGGLTMSPKVLAGFMTDKGNMFVQGILVGLMELIIKSHSQDEMAITKDLSVN